jgi:hypothetical protein
VLRMMPCCYCELGSKSLILGRSKVVNARVGTGRKWFQDNLIFLRKKESYCE